MYTYDHCAMRDSSSVQLSAWIEPHDSSPTGMLQSSRLFDGSAGARMMLDDVQLGADEPLIHSTAALGGQASTVEVRSAHSH